MAFHWYYLVTKIGIFSYLVAICTASLWITYVSFAIFLSCGFCLIYWIVRTLYILRTLPKCPLIQNVFPDLLRKPSFLAEHVTFILLYFSPYHHLTYYKFICLLFVCAHKKYKLSGDRDFVLFTFVSPAPWILTSA